MKLRVDFGNLKKDVMWWKELKEFPLVISRGGQNWEWLCHDTDPAGVYDHILTFTPIRAYSAMGMFSPPTKFEEIWPESEYGCKCGAKFERGFEDSHYPFCPKYTKW